MFTKKGDAAVLAKLGNALAQYRDIGKRLHKIIRANAPSLEPIVRWGLPFYVKNGKDICYIKPDKNFIAFGFGEVVNPAYEEGASMHPVAWTLTSLDSSAETRIRELVKKAEGRYGHVSSCSSYPSSFVSVICSICGVFFFCWRPHRAAPSSIYSAFSFGLDDHNWGVDARAALD